MMPFLQPVALTFRVPLPRITRDEPSFALMAAPSKASATASSDESSLAGSSLSVKVTVPWISSVTSVVFLQTTGAVDEEDRVRSFKMSVTPVVPFFTTMLPSLQLPVTV